MTKLSDAQITALKTIHETGTFGGPTNRTVQALFGRELIEIDRSEQNDYILTTQGREAIGVNVAVVEESPESVEAPVFKLTRRMVREARRNVARYNRRLMRLQGKRARKYGVENVIIKHIAA